MPGAAVGVDRSNDVLTPRQSPLRVFTELGPSLPGSDLREHAAVQAVITAVIIAITLAAIGLGGRWVGLNWWPSATRIDADELYEVLAIIEDIFGQARASGGKLPRTWTYRGVEYGEPMLQLRLSTVGQRIGDKPLTGHLDDMSKQLRTVWANRFNPELLGPLDEETGKHAPDPSAVDQADKQRTAAEAGGLSVPAARVRLRTLENRARLQFAR